MIVTAWEKKKQGKPNPIPLPASKAADRKKEKERQRKKEKSKKGKEDKPVEKPKLVPKSGLGPTPPSVPSLRMVGPTTRHSPRKAAPTTSPEGAPLLTNQESTPSQGFLIPLRWKGGSLRKSSIREIRGNLRRKMKRRRKWCRRRGSYPKEGHQEIL